MEILRARKIYVGLLWFNSDSENRKFAIHNLRNSIRPNKLHNIKIVKLNLIEWNN